MKRIRAVHLCFLLTGWIFYGCQSEEHCNDDIVPLPISYLSLEGILPTIDSQEQLVQFLSGHPVIRDAVFNRENYPDDSVFIKSLFKRFTHPSIDTLLDEVTAVFGDGKFIHNALAQAFARIKQHYPSFKPPVVKTLITGLETDLFVRDSLVVIGLDYYLGEGARYRPNLYEYLLRRYEKEFVVSSIILLLSMDVSFNKIALEDQTVLAEMIAYGKAYYFASQMLPCVPDHLLIGYTPKAYAGALENVDVIWGHFVQEELFYETGHRPKQKYIAERPNTIEIGSKCPGRIGTWLGWQIVKAYMKRNPEVGLKELMDNKDAQGIFAASKYKPG